MKPRVLAAFQGWFVWGFGGRLGFDGAAPDDGAGVSAAALAREATSSARSFSRQQCLYLRPEPQ
jgi:hypothetical protein